MRARARIALVLMALSASFGLAGCAAIDELVKRGVFALGRVREAPETARTDRPATNARLASRRQAPCDSAKETVENGGQQAIKAGLISAQTATAADRCCASSKETSDPGLHRGGETGRHRGAIRAVPARAAAVA